MKVFITSVVEVHQLELSKEEARDLIRSVSNNGWFMFTRDKYTTRFNTKHIVKIQIDGPEE